jgi:DNA invertase Pin-like site-specific DNA recombinase
MPGESSQFRVPQPPIGRGLAVLYAAKSTNDLRGSIPTQLADAKAMAEREGFQVVEEYRDEAKSAYKGNRGPDLAAAKAHAANLASHGHEAAIFVQHSDRIARGDGVNASQLIQHVWDAQREGYALRSVQDDSTFTEQSGLMAFVMGIRNHDDSKRKSAAVAAGKRRAAQRGEAHGGWRPYGYRYGRWREGEQQGLLIIPEEAEVVRRIYREWRQGRPQKDIARGLNADSVPAQRASLWGQSSIGRMLRNPVYVALREVDGELIPADHDPILPLDEWEEAQRRLAPRGSKKRSGRPAPGFLLRGLLFCGECGEAMHTDRGRTSKRYVCYTRERNPQACSQRGIRSSDMDEGVLSYFEDACLDAQASWQACREAADARVAEARALRKEADREAMRVAAQLDKADDDYGAGALDAENYTRLRAKWGEERDAALAEVERLRRREEEIARVVSPDLAQRLAVVREAVAGRVRDARDDEGVEAVRAALQSLFDGFIVSDAPTQPGAVKSYRVVPRLREDVAGGHALIPGRKVALVLPPEGQTGNPAQEAEEKYHVAEALSYRSPDELSSV